MKSIQEKLDVLSKLAAKFNKEGIVWAVGGSLLLYFKGYVENFNDLDIMVADVDALKMENILKFYGKMLPLKKENCDTKVRYETKHCVSREVPRSILKYKTVLGTLDATPKVP